jgi:folate-binding protein YgfZ
VTYRSPALDRPGAVAADPPDAGVAAHYGDPMREQRLLAAGGAVVDLSHRGVVRVAGPDRLSWLHDLTSQDLARLAPGVATEALLLDPHGHVEHHLRLVDDGAAVLASVEPGTAPALASFLDRMRFLLRVEVADVTDDWAVLASADPGDGAGHLRERLIPRAELPAALDSAPALAGVWAFEALRIVAGQPRLGVDTDARTIPNEVGWLGVAVALDKGCYRGQETVARVHTLGRPPRRLTLLHLDGHADRLPAVGSPVLGGDGRQAGVVGSSARHFEAGPVALALLKRSVPVSEALTVDGIAAAQDVLVDPEVGLHVRPRLG